MSIYSEGSDHQVWTEGSWRVPAIYLNDWPDRYIHTHADGVANIDASKLLRAGFLGAASAYYLATLDSQRVPALWQVIRRHSVERAAEALAKRDRLAAMGQPRAEQDNVLRYQLAYERGVLNSIAPFGTVPEAEEHFATLRRLLGEEKATAPSGTVYRRAAEPKGPMDGFGYSWFRDKTTETPALLRREPLWSEASYGYEALNLVDGRRTVKQIRDDLSAIYGPVPLEEVTEYLDVLRRIGLLEARTPSSTGD